jgi:hypothetical protein
MVAGHICSYACLFGTAVDDPHNLCLFKDQPVRVLFFFFHIDGFDLI